MESAVTAQTALTECGEPHQLLSEITLTKYGNVSATYQMCSDNTRKITSTAV